MNDNIEIVIKISEKEYNGIKEDNSGMFGGHIYQAIKDGRKLSDYPPNYQRMAIGLPPVIHHEKPITKEDIDKSAWIPVTEGLPKEGRDVLVCDSEGDIYINHLYLCGEWGVDEFGNRAKKILAWMPLPKAYKESEE